MCAASCNRSILLRGGGPPCRLAAGPRQVEAAEQHCQLGSVEPHSVGVGGDLRQAEAPLGEALVVDDEAAVVPEQDLDAIAAPSDEDEQMAGVGIELEGAAD